MVKGEFTGDIPIVRVNIGWKESVQSPFVILDTGFTGDLQVTPQITKALN